MTVALNDLGSTGSDIVPYFVTVDPGRDTPEALSAYVANFHPRLVGLTGTPAEVAEMAKAYRVYYARVENQSSPADYLMDHSSIIYLMGPDGKFLKHFTYTSDAKALAAGLKEALGR
jgi:protein SCO1/2